MCVSVYVVEMFLIKDLLLKVNDKLKEKKNTSIQYNLLCNVFRSVFFIFYLVPYHIKIKESLLKNDLYIRMD